MKLLLMFILIFQLTVPAAALEIQAPEVPHAGSEWMPDRVDSFPDAMEELLRKAIRQIYPEFSAAVRTCVHVLMAALLLSVLRTFSGNIKSVVQITGTAVISTILFRSVSSMIQISVDTIREISDYGKLLIPVMTSALAAQGGMTSSAALFTGTVVFDTVLGSLISKILVPLVYVFLAFAVVNSALKEDFLKKTGDMVKNLASWSIKTVLMVFTTYMSITGVVSGTTDAAALKATKVTISSVVPVIGGIMSDASEAVLVSAGMLKNAAGIYGILAIIAVFIGPFLRISVQYLTLKVTFLLSSIFAGKEISGLVEDFSAAMGLLLAMTSAVGLLFLISTVCCMKGLG